MEFLPFLYRRAMRRERVFRNPLDPLAMRDAHLIRYYRFPRHEILDLCRELTPYLERPTSRSHAIPVHTQVLTALRFYASGTFQSVLGDSLGLSQTSVSNIIRKVSDILFRKAINTIKMPSSQENINKTKQDFFGVAGFPNVVGAIDCTHIPIKAPYEHEALYVNRNFFHTINIQAVCNSDFLILSFVAKYPGSTHDSFIWRNSNLQRRFEQEEFGYSHLLGDSGYPLQPFLLTPIRNPREPAEERYNRSHKKTRSKIEQTFGIVKSRFRCLHQSGGSLQYNPTKCAKIAGACMLLHNRCISRNIPLYEEIDNDDPPAALHEEARPNVLGVIRRQEIIQQFQ